MGARKHLDMVEELFKQSPVVSFDSISRIVKDGRKKSEYAKQLIRNLIIQGKVKRLTKGFYTAQDNPELIVFCFNPSYLGLQDALSFHGLWEQETIPIIITSRKIRSGLRNVNGANVLIRRLDKKYFFGVEYYKYDGKNYLPYSDIEKTFIDLIYFNEKISEEALKNIKERIDKKKLCEYLKEYNARERDRITRELNK
jgi:predicted transcriptional regulator of viral defense system